MYCWIAFTMVHRYWGGYSCFSGESGGSGTQAEIGHGDIMDISFIDDHYLLYRTPYDDETRSVSFEIYQLPDGVEELSMPKQRAGKINWKVTVLGEGGWIGYDTIVKYFITCI